MPTSPIVILVEPDAVLSSTLRLEFERMDFAVLRATSNAEAEEYAAQTIANLVVLHVGNTEWTGYQTCARLRKRKGYANRPIVLTTNNMSSENIAAAEKVGVSILLNRPYAVVDLIRSITPFLPPGDPLIAHRPVPSCLSEPMLMRWEGPPRDAAWAGLPFAETAPHLSYHSSNEGPTRPGEGQDSKSRPARRRTSGRTRPALDRDLRSALERRQLQLHYQPIVNCVTGNVESFEALLRWNHPQRGMVPPLEFIALAEATGLIFEIGSWVLETACAAAVKWQKPYRVAVNVSPLQVHQRGLPESISGILDRTGLQASRLEIELTEGILVEDTKQTAGVLSALRNLGMSIVMDDFGTGYSGLSYLHAFKFDKLKIDRSFIMQLGETADASIIVRTMIGLAHDLGLSTVAEGVETVQQLTELRGLECDQVQGYLLGRPTPMDDSANEMAISPAT